MIVPNSISIHWMKMLFEFIINAKIVAKSIINQWYLKFIKKISNSIQIYIHEYFIKIFLLSDILLYLDIIMLLLTNIQFINLIDTIKFNNNYTSLVKILKNHVEKMMYRFWIFTFCRIWYNQFLLLSFVQSVRIKYLSESYLIAKTLWILLISFQTKLQCPQTFDLLLDDLIFEYQCGINYK